MDYGISTGKMSALRKRQCQEKRNIQKWQTAFLCGNEKCGHKTFIEHYTNSAYDPNIRSRIFFSAVNGSGTQATARTLGIAKATLIYSIENKSVLL
jgi:hypothetical protein